MTTRPVLDVALSLCAAALILSGCQKPLQRTTQQELRDQLIESHRAYLRAISGAPVIEVTRPRSDVDIELTAERREELDRMSGPSAYRNEPLQLGPDLLGQPVLKTVSISLLQAVQMAAQNNYTIHLARIQPAVTQAQVLQAEAAFDPVYFLNLDYQNLDTPKPASTIGAFGSQKTHQFTLTTGVKKAMITGGEITAQTSFQRQRQEPSIFLTNAFETADVTVSLTQPLLRNFGSDINQAQIFLTRSSRAQSVADLRGQLLQILSDTEEAYWTLVFARHQLLIRERLLQRTIVDRDQLKKRLPFDVSPVRMTEANSFVELRRAEMIRAQQIVRVASDRLKQLVNSPDFSVADEILLEPLDQPADSPVSFSFLDAVTTALRQRPELRIALSRIEDASIRQQVADNQKLPLLNLGASVRLNGVGSNVEEAYDPVDSGQFVDYLLSAQFELPIGNRAAEALYRQRQLERQAAVVAYQQAAQQVVLDVKDSLRNVLTTYQLIGAARAARLAASDNLRAIEEQEKAGVALTPEFLLDLKLATQARLADAEVQEIQALTDYNSAIANFFRSIGTLLAHDGIHFVDPEPDSGRIIRDSARQPAIAAPKPAGSAAPVIRSR